LKKLKELNNQIRKEENEILRIQKQKNDEEKKIMKEQKRKKLQASLSFADDEDFDDNKDDNIELYKKKTKKNPSVDTSYLPDAERDRALEEKKEKLRMEWLEQQEVIKNELLEVGMILLLFIIYYLLSFL
jgi:protein FAM50